MAILDTATAGVDAGVISHIGATNAEPAWLGDLRATWWERAQANVGDEVAEPVAQHA